MPDQVDLLNLGKWNIAITDVAGDGSCLFHAILQSVSMLYRECTTKKCRFALVNKLRNELADIFPSYYYKLGNGYYKEFSQAVEYFSLEAMTENLRNTSNFIGEGYIEFLSLVLEKDIYIINSQTNDLYYSDELKLSITGNRPSIVLYYLNNPAIDAENKSDHFQYIVIIDNNNTHLSHFSPQHSFIRHLYDRLQHFIK